MIFCPVILRQDKDGIVDPTRTRGVTNRIEMWFDELTGCTENTSKIAKLLQYPDAKGLDG